MTSWAITRSQQCFLSIILIVVWLADHWAIEYISLIWIPGNTAAQIRSSLYIINKFHFVLQASTFYVITLRGELAWARLDSMAKLLWSRAAIPASGSRLFEICPVEELGLWWRAETSTLPMTPLKKSGNLKAHLDRLLDPQYWAEYWTRMFCFYLK